jgi:hypothetical protein
MPCWTGAEPANRHLGEDAVPSSRSLHAIRPADRRCAAACGGRGLAAELAPVRGKRLFRAVPHMARDPRSCAHLESSTVYRIQRVHRASSVSHELAMRCPVAPFDPASDSRSGGALRRVGGGTREDTGLVLAYEAFQGCCPIWCAIHGPVPTWKAQRRLPYSRSDHASRLASRPRPVASCDPAGGARTGGARCGVRGEGAAMESAGLVLADEGFQGCCPHMAV